MKLRKKSDTWHAEATENGMDRSYSVVHLCTGKDDVTYSVKNSKLVRKRQVG